jgi:hypothetical protein
MFTLSGAGAVELEHRRPGIRAPPPGAGRRTRGFGRARGQRLGCRLSAPPPEEEDAGMFSSTPQPAADARTLHRTQRDLVAASLLVCPPRTTKPIHRRWV